MIYKSLLYVLTIISIVFKKSAIQVERLSYLNVFWPSRHSQAHGCDEMDIIRSRPYQAGKTLIKHSLYSF